MQEKKDSIRKLLLGTLSSPERGAQDMRRPRGLRETPSNGMLDRCPQPPYIPVLRFGNQHQNIIGEAVKGGKAVYVPAVTGDLLEFRRIISPDQPLETGVLGIREPGNDAPIWSLSGSPGPTLVLVPGLAFDTAGRQAGPRPGILRPLHRVGPTGRREGRRAPSPFRGLEFPGTGSSGCAHGRP